MTYLRGVSERSLGRLQYGHSNMYLYSGWVYLQAEHRRRRLCNNLR